MREKTEIWLHVLITLLVLSLGAMSIMMGNMLRDARAEIDYLKLRLGNTQQEAEEVANQAERMMLENLKLRIELRSRRIVEDGLYLPQMQNSESP